MSTRRSSFDGMSRTNHTRQEKKNRKDRSVIRNTDPLKFEGTYSAKIIDMHTVEDIFNQFFKLVFEDWYGCKLKFDQNGQLILSAYFKPIANPSDGANVAFKKIATDTKSEGLLGVAMSFKELNRGNNFKVTTIAAELLYDLLIREVMNNVDYEKPEQYSKLTVEMADPTNATMFQQPQGGVLIELNGLDISKLLGLIYGTKGENGSKCIYEITCNRIKSDATMYAQNNWILTIMRMDEEHYKEAMVVAGYSDSVSTFNITTA